MPDSFDYTTGTNSENVRLLQALIDDAPEYTEETNSRNANILKSIINNTEYTDAPQSEIEELLLRLKAKIGGEIEVDELNVTENGTYDAGVNKAYNPVNVELPLDGKTITANGTYTASEDNLAGYDEVTVAVQGYAKKSIANTPTPIATFNASALPMPSLTVGIEAVQSGTGDPSPTNIRPITGWSAVNVYISPTTLSSDGTTYTTTLKDGQGNPIECYGGELSNENGVQTLDNTHNSFDMGSVGWGYTNNRFFTKIDDIWNNAQDGVPTVNQLMCEIYKTVMYTNQPTGTVATWNGYIYVRDYSYSGDATAFKTAVAGYKIAYELATPQTIPQDNLPIATQDGTNNLWADSGDVQSGEYFVEL